MSSSSSDLILGLDVGTTAAKASLFSLDHSVRITAERGYPLVSLQPGWHVQYPNAIAAGVIAAMREAVSQVDAGRVMGISVSTAMHGLVGLDAGNRPVTELLTWADSRATQEAYEISYGAAGDRLHRVSGTPVHAMSPLVKLRWFAKHHPDIQANTAHWIGLKDWILVTLTGEVVTELSSASGSGMADLAERAWNPEAIELSGVREDQLPRILDTTDILPLGKDAADAVGLPAGLPVVVGAGDGPLGNLGTGALQTGVTGLSIGTSGALRMVIKTPAVAPGLFCYALTRDIWVSGGAISNGGMVQRWLTQNFAPGLNDAEACTRAEGVPPGSDGLRMIPYLVSERASLWDQEIRGAFLHVRRPHTPDHFVRAGIEGVALQLWTILRRLRTMARVSQVRATGGVFRSQLWRDVAAGVLNRPLVVTGAEEGSGLGAGILGLYALERVDSLMEGYQLLRSQEEDVVVEVSDEAEEAYEYLRQSMTPLLERYGRLSPQYAMQSRHSLAPGI
ncbi:MAG TPA: gluconokinase [Actinomycetaceae bacterium]|nr:gluconokinase [Actinomycetaceae bacterium]